MDLRSSKRRNPVLLLLFTMSVVSNLGSLIHPLPPEVRKQVRDLEKVSIRQCKSDCSLLFNSVCVKENLLPNYSNIRLHDEAARKEPFTLKYRLRLVQRELENARTTKPELRKQVRDLEKVSVRRCKAECSLLFNSVCAKESLLPNYSNTQLIVRPYQKSSFRRLP